MKIKKFNGYSEINESTKYPELDAIAVKLADVVANRINMETENVVSKMPYKAQYVLEELIKHLEAKV